MLVNVHTRVCSGYKELLEEELWRLRLETFPSMNTSTCLSPRFRFWRSAATPVTLCKGWQSGSNIQVDRNITLHDITNAPTHLIPIDTTPSHAHNQRLKPWSPLNHLLTYVILVRVACGSYIQVGCH